MARSRRWFTQTIFLTTSGAVLTLISEQRAHAQPPIMVATVADLVAAIGSDRTLELAPGSFTLSDLDSLDPAWRTSHTSFEPVYDGYELVISGVENLTLVGVDNTLSRLLTQPRYADVLKFRDCRGLSLQNLELAHTRDAGFCRGSVLSFDNCENVAIDRCVLVGSGTHGIEADVLKNLTCRSSVIKECTYGILCLNRAEVLQFEDCQFFDNTGFSMVELADCNQVSFANCLIYSNASQSQFDDDFMFNVWQSQGVEVVDCNVYDNQVSYLAPSETSLSLVNTTLERNSFARDLLYAPDQAQQFPPFCPL